MKFDKNYYSFNSQDSDRSALQFYYCLWKRYCGKGLVLEFGCGVGHLARRLSARAKTFALEINPYAIKRILANAPDVEIIGSLNDLPDGELDSIVSLHVLEHIGDLELDSIGKQFVRILKPGGRALLVMPDLDGRAHALKGLSWSAFSDPTHINLKGADEWRRLFEEQWKLDVVACFADGYYDFPYGSSRVRSAPGDAFRAARTLIQFLAARPLLRHGDGENVVFILEKRS